jgi:hypothetical protein
MSTFQLIQQITLPERMDADAFEEFMRDEYFPAVDMTPTRRGGVTGLTLLRRVTETTHATMNTFLMYAGFDGSAEVRVNEEVQHKFESIGPRVENFGAYYEAAVWPEDAQA